MQSKLNLYFCCSWEPTKHMATAVVAVPTVQSCRNLIKPSPFLAPIIVAAYAASRYKNVIGERFAQTFKSYKPAAVAFNVNASDYPILSSDTSSQGFRKEHALATGTPLSQLSSTSSPFLGEDHGMLSRINPVLSRRHRFPMPPTAAARDAFSFRLPVITEKPEWWWRTLACVPYLIALQISDVGFYLQPFSEQYEYFESLVYFVPGAITRLPSWFTLVYCYLAYVGIVKNKEWPHFFRFHLMMGLLMETALQVVWYTCNFMPLIHYNGRFGMHFWAAIGFAYITVLLQCIGCALAGSYVHIPFISDAAFIHTLFNMGGYHRPF